MLRIRTWFAENIELLIPGSILFGIIFIFIGILTIMHSENSQTLTYGFGFISIGLSAFSFTIAFFAISISVGSDNKMTAFANTFFKDIIDDFEDEIIFIRTILERDMPLRFPTEEAEQNYINKHLRVRKGRVWKCTKYIYKANGLKNWIEATEQNRIGTKLVALVKELPWENQRCRVINEETKNIINCYKSVLDFEISDGIKNTLMGLFTQYIAERRPNEVDNKEFVDTVYKELNTRVPTSDETDMLSFEKLTLEIRDTL